MLDRALALRGRGPYVVQAAIASLHADEPRDWQQIAALYGELARLTGSPVVELSRAVAVAEAEGPEAGLAIVDGLDLDGYRYLHATRGELLRRLGRTDEAARCVPPRARRSTTTTPSGGLLERRLAELAGAPRSIPELRLSSQRSNAGSWPARHRSRACRTNALLEQAVGASWWGGGHEESGLAGQAGPPAHTGGGIPCHSR